MGIYVDTGKLNALGNALRNKTGDFKTELGEVEKANNFLMTSWKSESAKKYAIDVDEKLKMLKDLVERLNRESDGLNRSSDRYSKAERDIGDSISQSAW